MVYFIKQHQPWLSGLADGLATSEPVLPVFNSCCYRLVLARGHPDKIVPCASKGPTSVNTSEPLSKGVNDVKFGRLLNSTYGMFTATGMKYESGSFLLLW